MSVPNSATIPEAPRIFLSDIGQIMRRNAGGRTLRNRHRVARGALGCRVGRPRLLPFGTAIGATESVSLRQYACLGMENRRNYYRILHVQPGAPVDIIRASYRTLMQRLRAHPDLGGDHWNATLINEAYAVLTDAARRAEYDRDFEVRVLDARSDTARDALGSAGASTGTYRECLFCKAPHRTGAGWWSGAICDVCGSPLRRSTPRRFSSGGKRAIARVPRDHLLQLYTNWPPARAIAARSRDVSPNGISFITHEMLPRGAIIKVDSTICRAVIQVANIRPDGAEDSNTWLVGAEFLSVLFPRSRGAFLSTIV